MGAISLLDPSSSRMLLSSYGATSIRVAGDDKTFSELRRDEAIKAQLIKDLFEFHNDIREQQVVGYLESLNYSEAFKSNK